MKFDNIVGNPPYQDTNKRNTTPHKLWIDFTKKEFFRLVKGWWVFVTGITIFIFKSKQ